MIIPATIGSPAMPVVAAVPSPSDPRTLYCVVWHVPGDPARYGTVRGFLHSDGTWEAWGGSYDKTLPAAIADMTRRAGWQS
jgi:hypothetical protein